MLARVEGLVDAATSSVDGTLHPGAHRRCEEGVGEAVPDDSVRIDLYVGDGAPGEGALIGELPARLGVERRPVERYERLAFPCFHGEHGGLEVEAERSFVVEASGGRQGTHAALYTLPAMRTTTVLALALATGWVGAQPMGMSRMEATVRARQAAMARQEGDLDEAIRLYQEAVETGAPPAAFRGLAECLEARQRWREAAGAWNRYAALALHEADRRDAAARAEMLRTMLTLLRVRVEPARAARTARVWIDREPPRWYAAGGVEHVAPGGRHRVRVEAPGYRVWEMIVPTAYGEAVTVVAALVPERDVNAHGARENTSSP